MQQDSQRKKSRILGIDPGSRVVGYAFIQAKVDIPIRVSDFYILDMGIIKADLRDSFPTRIGHLHEAVYQLAALHGPALCVMESSFLGKNVQSAIKLGQARGAMIAAMSRGKTPLVELSPTAAKRAITGQGLADKKTVSQQLAHLLGIATEGMPLDATDALALALGYVVAHHLGRKI